MSWFKTLWLAGRRQGKSSQTYQQLHSWPEPIEEKRTIPITPGPDDVPMAYTSTPTNYEDVVAFHRHFRLLHATTPGHLSDRKVQERIDFMQEELTEFIGAAEMNEMVAMADALVDLVYVAMGTAVMMGLPWEEIWRVVHEANMMKERRTSLTGDHHDIIKPLGWKSPDAGIFKALVRRGYTGGSWVQGGKLILYRDDPHHMPPAEGGTASDARTQT